MGMPVSSAPYYTVHDVLAIPDDGNRRELVYGELLVSPVPTLRHQKILTGLFRLLADYCDAQGVGQALMSPADLTWGRQDVLIQPDVFVIGVEDAAVKTWSEVRHVPLVAEVLSPSTKRNDRFRKRRVYQDRAVGVYWIIDPEEGAAEVWRSDAEFPEVEWERLTWNPAGASAPLVVDLVTLLKD
jgi:Uma2 family endonuclease